tara:strand:+ start:26 stop:256 length:231 start_codon:yes stop_codon:yes gene_type:complete
MARLGKRERAAKRARIERIKAVDYSYSIKSSHHNFESKAVRAYVCQSKLLTEKPMAHSLRHYKDLANGHARQVSFG